MISRTGSSDRHAPWLVGWLGLAVLGVANGAAREGLYPDSLSDGDAKRISTVVLAILILGYAAVLQRARPLSRPAVAWRIGALWLALTIAFEFGFGLLTGTPLEELLADYDVTEGRFWVLIPITTFVAPALTRALFARRR